MPLPSVAVASTIGRSGVLASGTTRDVAASRIPLVPPNALAPNDRLRASSRAVPSSGAGTALRIGRFHDGDSAQTPAHSAVQVASPRHQSRDPIAAPRSGVQSKDSMRPRQWSVRAGADRTGARPKRNALVPPASSSP
ncbi:hypothetical protein ACVOMT_08125 [Sphingomonas panni]